MSGIVFSWSEKSQPDEEDEDGELYTWEELIVAEMSEHGEAWSDLVSITLSDDEVNKKFDKGYGGANGKPFTAWTAKRVYFPVCYDGSEWCGSAPRNPSNEATGHQGGG